MNNNIVTVSGSKITINEKTLTVFNQHKLKGTYAKNISLNGCGICCTTFALILQGKKITPAEVIKKAISLWGKWPKSILISSQGIATIIKKYGYEAKHYNITSKNESSIKATIHQALMTGKQVICWTTNIDKKDPFSNEQHYVIAIGYNSKGQIVVANSGNKGPINLVTLNTLCKYLQKSNGTDKTWYKTPLGSAGIVVVGKTQTNTVKKTTTTTEKKKITSPQSKTIYSLNTLKKGVIGQQVKVLQKLLGDLTIDGDFGIETETKVKEYQKKNKLSTTGIVDDKTWDTLLKR